MQRASLRVGDDQISYLTAGDGPIVLLLHGTYWSRVWAPVIDLLAEHGLRPVAVDLPGCGRSGGRLTLESAIVPRLAGWVDAFLDALGAGSTVLVAGHDIGGAITQQLAVHGRRELLRWALVNSVSYDSWPVPAVGRFRDPALANAVTVDELVAGREQALRAAIARPMAPDEREEYLSPWREGRVARSWLALAGAADSGYTQRLLPALRVDRAPKLLVWGEDDAFQPIRYADRFVAEVPNAELVRIAGAGHIPMENDPHAVGAALAGFFSTGS